MGKRLIVEEIETEQMVGRIVIVKDDASVPKKGKVLVLGDTRKVKVGDTIVYGMFTGVTLPIEGVRVTILMEDDILGVYT